MSIEQRTAVGAKRVAENEGLSRRTRKKQKSARVEQESENDESGSDDSAMGRHSEMSPEGEVHTEKQRHVRFGSEEHDANAENVSATNSESSPKEDESEDSEDEAPEAFTKSDTVSAAKEGFTEAARAVERYERF